MFVLSVIIVTYSFLTTTVGVATSAGTACKEKQLGQIRATPKGTARCECVATGGKSVSFRWQSFAPNTTPAATLPTTIANIDTSFNSKAEPGWPYPGGKYFTSPSGSGGSGLSRLNPDGSVDTGFANAVGTANGGGNHQDVAVQADGKIVVVGGFTSWNNMRVNGVARLNPDGSRDESMNTSSSTATGGYPMAVAVQPDGKVVIGGSFLTWNGVSAKRLVRLNTDGTQDLAFAAAIGQGAMDGVVSNVMIDTNGKILLSGNFMKWNRVDTRGLIRLNSDGTLDMRFSEKSGTLGSPRSKSRVSNGLIWSSSVRLHGLWPDGKILVSGNYARGCAIGWGPVRLNQDGNPDNAFQGPRSTYSEGGASSWNATGTTEIRIDNADKAVEGVVDFAWGESSSPISPDSTITMRLRSRDRTKDIWMRISPTGSLMGAFVVASRANGTGTTVVDGRLFQDTNTSTDWRSTPSWVSFART